MITRKDSCKQTTIQTHAAVSVGAGLGVTNANWIDTDGYDNLSYTLLNDASVSMNVYLLWSNDGTTAHFTENTNSATASSKGGTVPTRARWVKMNAFNNDAAAHVMTGYLYLKA